MSQHSHSYKAFLNTEHAKVNGNIPDVELTRSNAHRNSWQLRQLSTLNTEASHPIASASSDSYEPNRLGSQS